MTTATVANLSDRRPNDRPDAEFCGDDRWGRKTFLFTGEYMRGNRRLTAEFWAYDHDDAEETAAALGLTNWGQVIEKGEW